MEGVDLFGNKDALSYKTKVSSLSRFRGICRKMDIYSLPITLRYKQEKKFFTNFGAATSFLLVVGMIALLLAGIQKMFDHEEIK